MGAIDFAFARYALATLAHCKWLHFANIFLGMVLGMQVDGSMVTGCLCRAYRDWLSIHRQCWNGGHRSTFIERRPPLGLSGSTKKGIDQQHMKSMDDGV
jgi:hypothetical protein